MRLTQNEDTVQEVITAAEKASGVLCGFDRANPSTMGIIQYCNLASSAEIHQIDEDGVYSLLTSQTHFADGTTAIDNYTLAQYHASGETSFSYWHTGVLKEVTGIKTLVFPYSVDAKYAQYNSDGDLEIATSTEEAILYNTLVAIVGYDSDTLVITSFADERHGWELNGRYHYLRHVNDGASHHNGGAPVGLADAATTIPSIEAGTIFDEDIKHSLAINSTGSCPFLYKLRAEGEWQLSASNDKVGLVSGGNTVYNKDTSGTWSLAAIGSDFVFVTLFATNDAINPYVKVVGQTLYGTRATARKYLDSALFEITTAGLPSAEFVAIGTWIVRGATVPEIEKGADDEIWVDHRKGGSIARY